MTVGTKRKVSEIHLCDQCEMQHCGTKLGGVVYFMHNSAAVNESVMGGGRGDQDRSEEYRQRSRSNGWEIDGCGRGKASYTIG